MFFAAAALMGIISLGRLGMELFPDITLPAAVVIVPSPGVGPYDVEERIARPLEGSFAGLEAVEDISSTSEEGMALVMLQFADGTEMQPLVPEIRERINDVEGDFPEGTLRSSVFTMSAGFLPTMQMVIVSTSPDMDMRRLVEDEVVPEFERVPGVAQIQVFGGRERAVLVELDLDTLAKLNIPIAQVTQAFEADNISLPAGSVGIGDQQMVLRTVSEFEEIDDIRDVVITMRDGVPIFLGDVANVEMGFRPQDEFMRTPDGEGVRLAVQKQPDHNTVDVNEGVREAIEELEQTLPPSVRFVVQEDQSDMIRESVGGVATAAWQGGLLAILVLLFFLRNLRPTFIIATVIPVSIVATFSLMDFGGMTLNMTSLMGVTLAVGMFVDNAVVILESIYRKQLGGLSPEQAAVDGAEEVGTAITASTLTTMSVFLPMLFIEGIAGVIFYDLSLTISFSLFMSLAGALVIIPILCAKFLRVGAGVRTPAGAGAVPGAAPATGGARATGRATTPEGAPSPGTAPSPGGASGSDGAASPAAASRTDSASGGNAPESDQPHTHEPSLADVEVHTRYGIVNRVAGWVQRVLQWLDAFYERAVSWALDHLAAVFSTAIVLLVLSVGSVALLGMEFIPEADEAFFRIDVETRPGAGYHVTDEKAAQIEEIVLDVAGEELIDNLATRVGDGGSNRATVFVGLIDAQERRRDIWSIMNEADRRIAGEVYDVDHRIRAEGMATLAAQAGGTEAPVAVRLTGDDLSLLSDYANELVDVVSDVDGTRNVHSSYSEALPELQFRVRRQEALTLGLPPARIAMQLRTAFDGTDVGRFSRDEDDYDIVTILREEDRLDRSRFENLFFVNEAGSQIPIKSVVDFEEGLGPLEIERYNRQRMVEVRAALTGDRALSNVVEDIEARMEREAQPPVGVDVEFTGAAEEMTEGFETLFYALLLAIGLVYMVMAGQFENMLNPLIVMFSVPFATIGLTAALLVTGTTFNILAFVGGILLTGLVVNNAIVLIDYVVLLRKRGFYLRDSLIEGGKTRLKPILMTTLTTLLAMVPMAIGIGPGGALMAPLGRAVVGGLITSTGITLILIPTLYYFIEAKVRTKPAAGTAEFADYQAALEGAAAEGAATPRPAGASGGPTDLEIEWELPARVPGTAHGGNGGDGDGDGRHRERHHSEGRHARDRGAEVQSDHDENGAGHGEAEPGGNGHEEEPQHAGRDSRGPDGPGRQPGHGADT